MARILNLISGPRNISTALMYSFAQRSDTTVADEPFYAVYLLKSGALHPGREEVLAAQPHQEHEVVRQLGGTWKTPLLFVKNMAHHLEVLSDPLLGHSTPVFLIRDPRKILASYTKVMESPTLRDIGVAYQYELFEQVRSRGDKPVVIDSGLLLQHPEGVLRKLCNACDIPFEQRMLHWPSGPKVYDGVWATHWYANVHRSSGFETPSTTSPPLPERLEGLCTTALGFYEKLLPFSLKA